MAAIDFSKLIIDKLKNSIGTDPTKYGPDTQVKASSAISLAITEYLLKNTRIIISYSGVIPVTGLPDPIVTDSLSIVGSCLPIIGIDFNTWIKNIESNIISGFKVGIGLLITPIVPIPCFISGLEVLQNNIKTIVETCSNELLQLKTWEYICQCIINWLTVSINPTPFPAKTMASIGTSTILKIIII